MKDKWILGGASGRLITTESGYCGDGFIADVDTKENARRIVACVNALEGVPTEELEKAGTGMMSDVAVSVGKLTAQNAELLAALKGLLEKPFDTNCDCKMCNGKKDTARAAIAKMEDGE